MFIHKWPEMGKKKLIFQRMFFFSYAMALSENCEPKPQHILPRMIELVFQWWFSSRFLIFAEDCRMKDFASKDNFWSSLLTILLISWLCHYIVNSQQSTVRTLTTRLIHPGDDNQCKFYNAGLPFCNVVSPVNNICTRISVCN